jgi:hypothetical protein
METRYTPKITLEKILEYANSMIGHSSIYLSTLSRASHQVIHNSSYGAQLFQLNYICFCNGKFVPRCKDLPPPLKVAAQYVAKKIIAENINFPRAKKLDDENCSLRSASSGLKYLHEMKILKIHHKSRRESSVTYEVIDMQKLEQISEGKFT